MSDAKVFTEEDVKIRDFKVLVRPRLLNPYEVKGESLEVVGYATLSFVDGGLQTELFLNPNTPERLDMEVNPDSMLVDPDIYIDGNAEVHGTVWLRRR